MSEPLCRHETITTWGTSDNRLWACTSCSRRFYPACETCVDVGHRNETHPLAAPAKGLRDHPGRPHEYHATCRICGEMGYINLTLIAGDEAVQVVKRSDLPPWPAFDKEAGHD